MTVLRLVRASEMEAKSKKSFEEEVEEVLSELGRREMTLSEMSRKFRHGYTKLLAIMEAIQNNPEKELVQVHGNKYGRTTYTIRNRGAKGPLIRKATVDLLLQMLREEALSFEELKFKLASPPLHVLQLLKLARANYGHRIVERNGMYFLEEGSYKGQGASPWDHGPEEVTGW